MNVLRWNARACLIAIAMMLAVLSPHLALAEGEPGLEPKLGHWPVAVPEDTPWTVEQPEEAVEFFVLSHPVDPDMFFTMAPVFSPMDEAGAVAFVESVTKGLREGKAWYIRLAERIFAINTEEERVPLQGAGYSGAAAIYDVFGDEVMVVYAVSDGSASWQGQFSGSPDGWKEAQRLLESIEPKTDEPSDG